MIKVTWIKTTADKWCPFETISLENVSAEGVYIIWHTGNPGRVVRVGQGIIADRIRAHRKDNAVTKYASQGNLFITWASVPKVQRDGVERYLANKWKPLVGDAWPDVLPLEVNSPW